MSITAKKTVPFVVITVVALYGIWRRCHAGNRKNSCKAETSKEDCSGLVTDRLSELPNDVLSHVLSYLSLRDVARMSTVSKNWRNLSLALPSLNLEWFVMTGSLPSWSHLPVCEPYKQVYVKNVNRVLEKYRGQNILSFNLSCCLNNNFVGDADRWISFASESKGLRNFSIYWKCLPTKTDDFFPIDGSYFSQFPLLKDLRLYCCVLKMDHNFRPSSLTTLDLNNVILQGANWQDILLLSCLSSIEFLCLRSCSLPSKLSIGNNFHRLSFLLIGSCSSMQELELSVPNLKKFEFYGEEALKCSFRNVLNLESVFLFPDNGAEDVFNNFTGVSSLKYLCLRGTYPMIHKLPCYPRKAFVSVSSLRIIINKDDGNLIPALPRLLKSFPSLEKLQIKLPRNSCRKRYDLPIPCVHTNLKEVELSFFGVAWMPVASYLLRSAFMLDRMVITKSYDAYVGFASWHFQEVMDLFSDKERKNISNALIGKASSTIVKMIIK